MPRPELERMTVDQKAQMCEHVVRAGWDGLGVEVAWMLDGEFAAMIMLPAELGTPEFGARVFRALAELAEIEAEDLERRQRGMRPEGTRIANLEIIHEDDQSPTADALFRIGFAPVVVQDPSCLILFPGAYKVTPWTLRTFSRLATEQANALLASYPETRPTTSRAAAHREPGPVRAARFGEQETAAAAPRFRDEAPAPRPPSRVQAAREAFVDADTLGPDDPGYQDDAVPEPEGEYPPPGIDRSSVPPPPPPEARQRGDGRARAPRLRPAGPAQRQGPLTQGVGGEGMPAKAIDPIEPRVHSRHSR